MTWSRTECRHGWPVVERPVQQPDGSPMLNHQGEPMTATVGGPECTRAEDPCSGKVLSGPHVLYPYVPPKPEAEEPALTVIVKGGRLSPNMSEEEDRARLAAIWKRGCYCGYWNGFNLLGPHPRCSCAAAEALRQAAKPPAVLEGYPPGHVPYLWQCPECREEWSEAAQRGQRVAWECDAECATCDRPMERVRPLTPEEAMA